jgi:hypothetical protein
MRDIQGEIVPVEEEFLLVFGGYALRNLTVSDKLLFNNCTEASRAELIGQNVSQEYVNNCGAELLNEVWRYSIQDHSFTYIKPTYNKLLYSAFTSPTPRQGHAGAYAEVLAEDILTKQMVRPN